MAILEKKASATLSLTENEYYLSLLNQSFLFSHQGTAEDYTHQLLELNGLACQLNNLLQHSSNDLCAQSSLGILIPQDLTAVEAYLLGKKIGQQEYQQYTELTGSPRGESLPDQLCRLVDWWSQSYLAYYGQLLIDFNSFFDSYISLEVVGMPNIKLKKQGNHPNCAFYAGIISSFLSGLVGSDFDAIEPDCRNKEAHTCTFLLGQQTDLNALYFWQTVDA
ncbi:hypothetical protein [Acaryochloris sp. IP29b_bin.137]|uniref:V4R domain-containing protein n=1 Tax=Acaryochloris sp. IP29b_bin.137 TaxID=2969217 RepID=UPI00260F8EF8|nr:hypothetical protein [Acaryochloris sp. IP29b_bin.137]